METISLLGAFENTTVGISLVVGGSSAVAMSTLLIILERQVSLQEYGKRGLPVLNLC